MPDTIAKISTRFVERFVLVCQRFHAVASPRRCYLPYLLIFLICVGYFLSGWPIVAGDTDLWYHLNAGRYILENGTIPRDSFFSFVEPPRPWVDYYWLFQVVVHKIHAAFEYKGLIWLREGTFLCLAGLLIALFFRRLREDQSLPYLAVLFFLTLFILFPRYQLIRPHMLSYAFIAAFLYILEVAPSRAFILPLLSVLWVNIHGIYYPLILLIVGSYLIEFIVQWARERPSFSKADAVFLSSCGLALMAVFLSPHGTDLLRVPFVSTDYASQYISEFKPLTAGDLLSVRFERLVPTHLTLVGIMVFLGAVSLSTGFWRRSFRISHVLLLAGGVWLLSKGNRFANEFSLLLLPLLKANPPLKVGVLRGKLTRPVAVGAVVLAMVIPFVTLLERLGGSVQYPFSAFKLPEGNAVFLKGLDVGGRVLNHPNTGGYLQWMLYPRYKIFSDMQVPFLFSDEDMFVGVNVFRDEEVFGRVVSAYRPLFLSVPSGNRDFPKLVSRHPEYVAVFFDDAEVLYVDASQRSEIAGAHALGGVDPFRIKCMSRQEISAGGELLDAVGKKLLSVHTHSVIANRIAAIIAIDRKDYQSGLTHARRLMSDRPDLPWGFEIAGDALRSQGKPGEAIEMYAAAGARSKGREKNTLYLKLGEMYAESGDHERAYMVLKEAIRVFSAETSHQELASLANAAERTGRRAEAEKLRRMAREKEPSGEERGSPGYAGLRADGSAEGCSSGGVSDRRI